MSGKGYPTQNPPYPVQQHTAQFAYPQSQAQPWQATSPPMYGAPNDPPPPYSYQAPPQQVPQQQPMPNYQMYPTQVQNVQMYTQGSMPAGGPVATASFDSAARFDGVSQPRIPPPPPGYMPTAAQQAVMQGRPVVATQQKAGWFSGSGGGYTWGGL